MLEGDTTFEGVVSRGDPASLPPGMVAEAVNLLFRRGQALSRPGIVRPAWGRGATGTLVQSGLWSAVEDGVLTGFDLPDTWETDGVIYRRSYSDVTYAVDANYLLGDGAGGWLAEEGGMPLLLEGASDLGLGAVVSSYYHPDEQRTAWTTARAPGLDFGAALWAKVTHYGVGAAADGEVIARFNDPNGIDALLLLTRERRADGGRGRCYRLVPGNARTEVPLNGHDVWGETRLGQGFDAMIALRHGNQRQYFSSSGVDTAADTVTLNCEPQFENVASGARVIFRVESGYLSPLQANARYWLKAGTGNAVEIYTDDPDDGGTAIDLVDADGYFYFEADAATPGRYGNAARPLVMQPSLSGGDVMDAYQTGFNTVDETALLTAVAADNVTFEAANHRLEPGVKVALTGLTFTVSPTPTEFFAGVVDAHHLRFYDSATKALGGLANNALVKSTLSAGATVAVNDASVWPMPGGREFIVQGGRLIIAYDRDQVAISDVGDFLHFAPWTQQARLNQGEADEITGFAALGPDSLLIFKRSKVYLATGLSNLETAVVSELTRAFGCVAPKTITPVGEDVWFLSRKGVASIKFTESGEQIGQSLAVSEDMAPDVEETDWAAASGACAIYLDNLFLIALPTVGEAGAGNTRVLVFDFRQRRWSGRWESESLHPKAWAALNVYGAETVCWLDDDGVNHFAMGLNDHGTEISTRLRTRAYRAGTDAQKRWGLVRAGCAWHGATVTLGLRPDSGTTLEVTGGTVTADPEKFRRWAAADFQHSEGWGTTTPLDAADRDDVSIPLGRGATALQLPTPEILDRHTPTMIERSVGVTAASLQIELTSSAGSVRWNSVAAGATDYRKSAVKSQR